MNSAENVYPSLRQLGVGKPLDARVDNLETQVDIHTSRFESEQGSRSRAHKILHERLDAQDTRMVRVERVIYIGMGVLILAQPVLIAMLVTLLKNQVK